MGGKPFNGDPFIGMLETPVTSAPIVANYLSNLPAYRTGVAPLLRGVEVGLAHGFFFTWTVHQIRTTEIYRGHCRGCGMFFRCRSRYHFNCVSIYLWCSSVPTQ